VEVRMLAWPVYKALLRTIAGGVSLLSPQLVMMYASVAAVADDSRAALLPTIVDALTAELVRSAEAEHVP
jgi:hypothetical protein